MANALLERLLHIHSIKHLYAEITPSRSPLDFVERALETLRIRASVAEREIRAVPASGPVIVVANHPFGGIDGLILASVLSAVRTDFKLLANHFLALVPELQSLLFLVDPFERKGSVRRNAAALKRAVEWVRQGGVLGVFPAGEVSHLSWKTPRVVDPPWKDTVARLVELTQAPVVPIFFEGRNSNLFQVAGLLHPLLRTFMLPREVLKKNAACVRVKVGQAISYRSLKGIKEPAGVRDYLRFRTYLLAKGLQEERLRRPLSTGFRPRKGPWKEVAPQQDALALKREIAGLNPRQRLLESGHFAVYQARSGQIPRILGEIGRLREETFREAGEGTGNAQDLDRFDNIYQHLFVWNTARDELVGAYRMGPTDEILPRHGRKGLYTHTLFRYGEDFLAQIGPALELGRSFVRSEYQKSYSPLLLLWKGIGRYLANHPRYRVLFGPVSISDAYRSCSRQLMVEFLRMNRSLPDLGGLVKARRPFLRLPITGLHWNKRGPWADDIEELSAWVAALEEDGKGVPVLLKQYLKLGGKVLSFNVDRKFNDALDGLIVVDLDRTETKLLGRYMGAEGLEAFLGYRPRADLPLARGRRVA